MPNLDHAVEAQFGTDFAILVASQPGVEGGSAEASFASSTPGFVSLECGSKYSNVRIRAELWDKRPPLTDEWEDFDELPFEEVPGAGKLMLSGFDPGDVGLDVEGLGRGRIQILARGRHRYDYSSSIDVDTLPPEEWLLRLYPREGRADPMEGGPRRIAGGGGLSRTSRPPWSTAVLGYRTSGWSDALGSSHGFYLAQLALLSATAPLTRRELAAQMVRRMPPWEVGGPNSESVEVPPRPSLQGDPDPLETLSGHGTIATIGDVIDAMLGTGLLLIEARAGARLLIPNPSPTPAWERIGMTGPKLVWARSRALESEHRAIASDVLSAARWLSDIGLTATPRVMAIRWSTSVEDVIGGVRLLGGSEQVSSDRELGFDVELDPDEAITLWPNPTAVPPGWPVAAQ